MKERRLGRGEHYPVIHEQALPTQYQIASSSAATDKVMLCLKPPPDWTHGGDENR